MDNERDEILKDLFDYYDTESQKEDAVTEDIDNTIVMPAKKVIDDMDDFAEHTIVVNTAETRAAAEAEDNMFNTTVIEPPIHQAPAEEMLGALDLSGRPTNTTPEYYRRSALNTPMYDIESSGRKPSSRRDSLRPPETRPTGMWFTLKPLWVSLILSIIMLGSVMFYATDTGPIGIYKRNFKYNLTLIMRAFGVELDFDKEMPIISGKANEDDFFQFGTTVYAEDVESTAAPQSEYKEKITKKTTIPFTGAGLAQYSPFKDGVVCAKSNYICYIAKNGKIKWEHSTSVSDPILSVAGDYVALASEDSTQLYLFKKGEIIYTIEASENIKTCSVSSRGDVAITTEKTAYKGAVSVFNKKGEEVFSWVSGVNYITSATVTKDRRVAVSLINTDKSVTSYVMVFDIFSPDPISGTEFGNTLIYDTKIHKNNVYAYGDNSIAAINKNGATQYNIKFDNMPISHSTSDANGWRLVAYTDEYLPFFNIYDSRGNARYTIDVESSPDYVDLNKANIVYSIGHDIICGRATSDRKTKYTSSMTVKKLVMITSNTYAAVYDNSIEIIKI